MTAPDRAPPEGFIIADRRGPFTLHNGPVFVRPGPVAIQGFYALNRHCNGLGIVHGGMLASFIDGLLGHACGLEARSPAVTIHLSLDYLAMAREGDWIEGEARVVKRASDIIFAEGRGHVGARDVIRASGVFKVMERRQTRQG